LAVGQYKNRYNDSTDQKIALIPKIEDVINVFIREWLHDRKMHDWVDEDSSRTRISNRPLKINFVKTVTEMTGMTGMTGMTVLNSN